MDVTYVQWTMVLKTDTTTQCNEDIQMSSSPVRGKHFSFKRENDVGLFIIWIKKQYGFCYLDFSIVQKYNKITNVYSEKKFIKTDKIKCYMYKQ